MAVLQTGLAKSLAEDYTVDQSLRFNDGDDAKLTRTPGSSGDLKTWTFSFWAKRGNISNAWQRILSAGTSGSNQSEIVFGATDVLRYETWDDGTQHTVGTDRLFRDPGSWYHCMVVNDTTESVAADRVKIYVNGELQTAITTGGNGYPAEDSLGDINSTMEHIIGTGETYDVHYDGYLAEVYFIDGTAYDADSFGETDSHTNQWKPIDASGLTFGTNGFYQKYAATELANSFKDSSNGFIPS